MHHRTFILLFTCGETARQSSHRVTEVAVAGCEEAFREIGQRVPKTAKEQRLIFRVVR
jgi:hypothetical protein